MLPDWFFWDDLNEVDDETVREQATRMFYRMEGWEKYWPYEQRPGWLRVKYP